VSFLAQEALEPTHRVYRVEGLELDGLLAAATTSTSTSAGRDEQMLELDQAIGGVVGVEGALGGRQEINGELLRGEGVT